MYKNEFALGLLSAIKDILSYLGVRNETLDKLDDIIFLILIILIAFVIGIILHLLARHFIYRLLKINSSLKFEYMATQP